MDLRLTNLLFIDPVLYLLNLTPILHNSFLPS
jgi:hypothetical protein